MHTDATCCAILCIHPALHGPLNSRHASSSPLCSLILVGASCSWNALVLKNSDKNYTKLLRMLARQTRQKRTPFSLSLCLSPSEGSCRKNDGWVFVVAAAAAPTAASIKHKATWLFQNTAIIARFYSTLSPQVIKYGHPVYLLPSRQGQQRLHSNSERSLCLSVSFCFARRETLPREAGRPFVHCKYMPRTRIFYEFVFFLFIFDQ